MSWKPSEELSKYLQLIIFMTTDCLMGNGVDVAATYASHLRILADIIDEKSKQEVVND